MPAVPADKLVPILSQDLLLCLAGQIKMPLLQIARKAEIAGIVNPAPEFRSIQSTADTALRLIDSYSLAVQMALETDYALATESVSVSAVLYDVGQQLFYHAKSYGVELELSISGKCGPVISNRMALESALASLGYSLIEAMPAVEYSQLKLQLAAHHCRYGTVAGLYSDVKQLTTDALRQGRKLYGRTRQPVTNVSHTSGAGLFVADALFSAMNSRLQISRHHNLYGLGAVLEPNHQLQLV